MNLYSKPIFFKCNLRVGDKDTKKADKHKTCPPARHTIGSAGYLFLRAAFELSRSSAIFSVSIFIEPRSIVSVSKSMSSV